MPSSGVVIFSPPWPRSGTANIIAAQTRAHQMRGEAVYILLEPLNEWDTSNRENHWSDIIEAFRFDASVTVDYPRVTPIPFIKRLLGGLGGLGPVDDTATAIANFSASGELPASLFAFIERHDIAMLRVNHIYGIKLALQIRSEIAGRGVKAPVIILDTHDIQSRALHLNRWRNPLSRKLDSIEKMEKGEIALAAKADLLVHVSKGDFDFFRRALPRHKHLHVPPTLNPGIERQLIAERDQPSGHEIDFVYLGNHHAGNLADVKWLLTKVLSYFGRTEPKLRIVGTIDRLFGEREARLFRRHRKLFVGEIPTPMDAYRAAKAVLVPAVAGTGASIKLIEALCSAKPVITTTIGMRGTPADLKHSDDLIIADDPQDFARAMAAVAARDSYYSQSNAAIYDAVFSNAEYLKSLPLIEQALKQ